MDVNDKVYVSGTTSGSFDGQTNSGSTDFYLTKWDAAFQPEIQSLTITNQDYAMQWKGAHGLLFSVESATNLMEVDPWQILSTYSNVIGSENMSCTTASSNSVGFYRIKTTE